ncbi:MAG: site-specific DNA-methyltransferase, partial [Patescibacteria group bacterium]
AEMAWVKTGKRIRIFKEYSANQIKLHPTQKPQELMRWCVANYSKENDIILDPFLGSGTTAVAAKQLNRRFIGCEISEKYCEIARQRLRQDVLL